MKLWFIVTLCILPGIFCCGQINSSFYVVHDRLLDSKTHGVDFYEMDLSGDGNTVVFSGQDKLYENAVLYTIGSDGSNLQQISLPDEVDGIKSLCVDSAGTTIYFLDVPVIYRAVDGVATRIFHMGEDGDGRWDAYDVKCSGDGNYCFIRPSAGYDGGEILRINSDGSGMEQVMHHAEVERDGGYSGGLRDYDVNQDGSMIAFIMSGFHGTSGFKYKSEVFLRDAQGFHQITNESTKTTKSYISLSGDGSTIVFSQKDDENILYSIKPDGTGRLPLDFRGFNFSGMDVNYDGSFLLHGAEHGNDGRLVRTDGSGIRNLFTSQFKGFDYWNGEVRISDDGQKFCYIHTATEEDEYTYSLYVGHIGNPFAVQDAPLVEEISLNPSYIPSVNGASIILQARISDPQGSENLCDVECEVLSEGIRLNDSDAPVCFSKDPADGGVDPDETAGDGIFTTLGKTQDEVTEFSEACIRIGVMDLAHTLVVCDSVFEIRDATSVLQKEPREFLVWPNPVMTGSDIRLEGRQEMIGGFRIFSPTGALIYSSGNIRPVSGLSISTAEAELVPGLYFVEINTLQGVRHASPLLISGK